jgi:hypothetical protein
MLVQQGENDKKLRNKKLLRFSFYLRLAWSSVFQIYWHLRFDSSARRRLYPLPYIKAETKVELKKSALG